ncbi:MAG: hypothetical protein MI919_21370, partial [Holophagales bacterium]|nr:hypothetical protein [Holophagales bacterium]
MLRSASFRSPRAALVLALLFGLACPLPAQETDASDFVRETPDAEGHETPVPALTLTIPEAQGAGHRSPYEGKLVALEGVVTAIEAGKGFYLQDPEGDGDPTTSDALFVFAEDLVPAAKSPEGEAAEQSETLRIRTIVVPEGSNPAAAARADAARPALPAIEVGDRVKVTGKLLEIGEGEALTVTCLRASSFQAAEVTGEEPEDGAVGSLPEPVLLGRDGRPFPTEVLDDDGLARFEPTEDGLDFYEAVEGMRVEVRNARVVGPTNRHGDLTVVADRGLDATVATARGGLLRRDR